MGRSKEGGASLEPSPTPGGTESSARASKKPRQSAGSAAAPTDHPATPRAAGDEANGEQVNTEEKEASIDSAETADDASNPKPDAASDEGPEGAADGERPSVPPDALAAVVLPPIPEGPITEARSSEERQRDLELVRRVQAGERAAFRELFDRHHKRAFAVAFGVLKHRQDAMDVVQEGFVKVHKHIGSFQGTSSFYTWLYRIVMNLAIDQLRRRKTGRNVEYDDAVLRDGEAAVDDSILPRMLDENPRKAVIRRELLARMEAALAELPEYHRQVILLREVEGLSYEEMAEALDVPKGTIMSRLFHARRKMQSALEGYVDGDMDIEE